MYDQVTVADTARLVLADQCVAQYVWQPRLPVTLSPRPYLHPVRTLTGLDVTEAMPDDHLHHLGVGVAIPDVGGANFWGGRTFTQSRGSVLTPNHGTQHHQDWITRTDTKLVHDLRWTGPDGHDVLRERRRITALPVDRHVWALDFTFELTNVTTTPLPFASPATNGRPGAGYGGFFWRARRGDRRIHVLGPDRSGERHLHGQRTPWLALTGNAVGPWTLIFIADPSGLDIDPWFVRSRDYAGVGSALAWNLPLLLACGATLRRRVITVIAGGRLGSRQVEAVAAAVAAKHGAAG
jgi:hypothetical protein